MAKLFVVGTPIGNLEDITLRAIRILKEVEVIACEDTRVTKKLLDRYEIKDKKLVSFNEQKSGASSKKIIDFLEEEQDIAYVTDAGTPSVSDPGSRLVADVREEGYEVVAVPGASALSAAVSIFGIKETEFTFLGFLPHKKGRETLFREIAESKRTSIFYESPHRVIKTLQKLSEYLGSERKVYIAREITKIYEEVFVGSAGEALDYFSNKKEGIKGEFVVAVSGC